MHRSANRKKTSGLPPFMEEALTAIAEQPKDDFIGGFILTSALNHIVKKRKTVAHGFAYTILRAALLDIDVPSDHSRLPWVVEQIRAATDPKSIAGCTREQYEESQWELIEWIEDMIVIWCGEMNMPGTASLTKAAAWLNKSSRRS